MSPIAATAITGFGLVMDDSRTYSRSSLVVGRVYAADYAPPTPLVLTRAIGDMRIGYNDAAGRPANVTELGAGQIGGRTLAPGVYKWSSGVSIPTTLTLSGSSSSVWIFQIAGTLTVGSGVSIILAGGAQAWNVFWQVASGTGLGTTSRFSGNILCKKAITLNSGAVLNGRALAQTAVTLIGNTVTKP